MIKRLFNLAAIVLTIALTFHTEFARAEAAWSMRCANLFSCDAETSQCQLAITVYGRASTQGSWVGILGVPTGWSRVTIRVAKGATNQTKTIQGPQLPRMAFGDVSIRDLLLAGESAQIEIFIGDQVAKSCHISLEGLAHTYEAMRQRIK